MWALSRRWMGAALLGLMAGAAWAEPSVQEALETVRETSEQVLERLRSDREQLQAEPTLIFPLVEDVVLPHFDFDRMSRWVLGRHWRSATAEQREHFIDAFRTLLVRTYGVALLEYTDQTIKYLPVRASGDADKVMVRTEIEQRGAPSIPIIYRMYLLDGAWKVVDLNIDGVSLVSNYRSSFGNELAQGGLQPLLNRLDELNAKGLEE